MITSWEQFCQMFGIGLSAGFVIGFTALSVRFVRVSYSKIFRQSANL